MLTKELGKALTSRPPAAVETPKVQEIQAQLTDARTRVQQAGLMLLALPLPTPDPASLALPAVLPSSPSSPNVRLNGVLGLVLGLALGTGFAFLRERLDDRLSSQEDFEEAIASPMLAVVPMIKDWRKRERARLITTEAPKSPAAEAYRTIRTNLQFIARGDGFKVLTVTSPSLGEGKTTTVANIAVVLAQAGKRVIALSCDLRKPRLHRFFGLNNKVGLSDVLAGNASFMDAMQRPEVENLRVVATGTVPPNPAELLGSEEMDAFLKSLRRYADFVLIDTPPMLAVSDPLVLVPKSDGVIMVADAETTTCSAMTHGREQIEQVGGNLVGGVLNDFDSARAKYYPAYYRYYYPYKRSYGYGSGPDEAAVRGDGESAKASDPARMWD